MVYNEAETLEATILSVLPIVSQVVIGVDRKSNDGTNEIARKYADVYFEYDFKDDFSAIRNQLIQKSTGDWILIMDGHEQFVNPERAIDVIDKAHPEKYVWYLENDGKKKSTHFENLNKIEELGLEVLEIKKVRIDGISVRLELEHKEGAVLGQQMRLIRNVKGVKYEGAVHNRLNVSTYATVSAAHLIIKHERSDKKRQDRKDQRARMILNVFSKRLEKNPNDCRAHYYLGCYWNEQKKHKKAERHFKQYIKHSEFEEEIYLAKWNLSRALIWQKKEKEAKQVLYDMMFDRWDLPLSYNTLGELSIEKKRFNEAEHWFKAGRDKKYPNVSCFFPKYQFTWFPWMKLTEVYSKVAYDDKISETEKTRLISETIMCGLRCFDYKDFPDDQKQRLAAHIMEWKKEYEERTGKSIGDGGARDRKHSNVDPDANSHPVARLPVGRVIKSDMARVEGAIAE